MERFCRRHLVLFLLLFLPGMASANQVISFTLVNADTNAAIITLNDGDTLNLAALPTHNLNVRADTNPAVVDSVSLSLIGATAHSQTEGAAPYALWGDAGGSYNAGHFNTGTHTLSATPTVGGIQGTSLSVHFSVVDNDTGLPTADAGLDQTVLLPTNEAVLNGSGSDDGTITAYQWTQVSGPNNAALGDAGTPTLTAGGLIAGTYMMRLTVTDDDDNTASDEAMIFVTAQGGEVSIGGELRKWHKVTLTFDGPGSSETATPNPFTDCRLNVTFTNGTTSYVVPGYYAADGNAANTGADSGNKWRVHFAPDATGTWNYQVSFRTGADVAVSNNPTAGSAFSPLDGAAGSLVVADTDKTGRDHRGKGRLEYIGGHYLKFAETGEYFLKQGADAPENFLAYEDFDNTPNNGGHRKSWSAHVGDWSSGDPTWLEDRGRGIIGAVNYLAAEGMNAFSFIPMNINGDDKNVFPYISDAASERTRMDCSKLDQWEIVFEHADHKGMFLHFKTQETENELLLDNGDMGTERKLYYRELIARFGHHLALNWNLGEEINDANTSQKQAWAQYFHDVDPYHHHIVIHNGANHYDLMGPGSPLTGFSLQTNQSDFSNVHDRVSDYLTRADNAGKPWAVACDEPGDASHALRPDNDAGNSHEDGRKNALWGTFMAGGWGNEWYFGYQHEHSDLTCQDFRSRDNWWDYCRYALEFFRENNIPFWQMVNDNALSSASNDYCFFQSERVYVVYLKNGGTTDLDLRNVSGTYDVQWFDPRNGGSLQNGSQTRVDGGNWTNLGNPPNAATSDWVVLVRAASALNVPPTADAGVNQTVIDTDDSGSESIALDGAGSSDTDGTLVSYIWAENGTQIATESNPTVDLAVGSHTIRLTVTDDAGATDTDTVLITVSAPNGGNHAPVIESVSLVGANPVVITDSAFAQVMASDPDDDPLTYSWTMASGPGTVAFDPNGTGDSDYCQIAFDVIGSYVLRVAVSDGDLTVYEDLAVTVENADSDDNTPGDSGGGGGGCFIYSLF